MKTRRSERRVVMGGRLGEEEEEERERRGKGKRGGSS